MTVLKRMGLRLDHGRRLVGTIVCFGLFALGGLVLSLFVFAPLNLVVADRDRRVRLAQHLVHRSFRLFVQTMIAMGVIDLRVDGGPALAQDQGRLIIANHPSLIDVVLIIALVRHTRCIVKHQHWRNPFMRGVLTATGYVRNDTEPQRLIEACAGILRAGHNLVIFPEGSRTVPGRPRTLQRGFASIAVAAGATIRLVTIGCVPPTLTKGEKWYRIPAARPLFAVRVHELIDVRALGTDCPPSITARRLTRHVARRLTEVLVDA